MPELEEQVANLNRQFLCACFLVENETCRRPKAQLYGRKTLLLAAASQINADYPIHHPPALSSAQP